MNRPSLIAVPAEAQQGPTVDYEVKNAVDRVVRTFNDASLARKWAKRMAPTLGDLIIEAVTVTVTRKRVTTVRPQKLELVR